MSLMLRKSCQEVLDNYGISDLHASMDTYLKLSIVSECGKPFVTIQGVEFTRQIPTKLEIDYATELLDNFLATHIEDIATYRRRKAIFDRQPTKPDDGDDAEFFLHGQSHGDYRSDLYVSWKTDSFTYQVNKKDKLHFHIVDGLTKETDITKMIAGMKKLKHDKKQVTAAKKFLKGWVKYDEERVFLVKLKSKLSSCNI